MAPKFGSLSLRTDKASAGLLALPPSSIKVLEFKPVLSDMLLPARDQRFFSYNQLHNRKLSQHLLHGKYGDLHIGRSIYVGRLTLHMIRALIIASWIGLAMGIPILVGLVDLAVKVHVSAFHRSLRPVEAWAFLVYRRGVRRASVSVHDSTACTDINAEPDPHLECRYSELQYFSCKTHAGDGLCPEFCFHEVLPAASVRLMSGGVMQRQK